MPVTAVSMVADLCRKTLIRESKHGDTDTVTLDIWRYLDTEPVVTLDIYRYLDMKPVVTTLDTYRYLETEPVSPLYR